MTVAPEKVKRHPRAHMCAQKTQTHKETFPSAWRNLSKTSSYVAVEEFIFCRLSFLNTHAAPKKPQKATIWETQFVSLYKVVSQFAYTQVDLQLNAVYSCDLLAPSLCKELRAVTLGVNNRGFLSSTKERMNEINGKKIGNNDRRSRVCVRAFTKTSATDASKKRQIECGRRCEVDTSSRPMIVAELSNKVVCTAHVKSGLSTAVNEVVRD